MLYYLYYLRLIALSILKFSDYKSGGYRSIILLKKNDKAFFVYAFGKNERDNITQEELAELKLSAKSMLNWTDEQIDAQIKNKILWELKQ